MNAIVVAVLIVGLVIIELISPGRKDRLVDLFFYGGGLMLLSTAWLLRIPGFRIANRTEEEKKNLWIVSLTSVVIPALLFSLIDSAFHFFSFPDSLRLMLTDIVLGSVLIPSLYVSTLKDRKFAILQASGLGMALAAFLFFVWLAGNWLGKT